MISPVAQAGAQPTFYPITASGEADLEWLERAALSGVRAMLATHYFGIPRALSRLRAFCDTHRIALIEDCAHAFFGACEGLAVGSWGDFAIASLPKFFPVPEGGLIASGTRSLNGLVFAPCSWRDEVKAAASAVEIGAIHGRFPGLNSVLRGVFGVKNRLRRGLTEAASTILGGVHADLSVDARLDSLRPAFAAPWIAGGVCKSRIIVHRRRNYSAFATKLSGMGKARALYPNLPEGAVPYVFPLYVDEPEASYRRLRGAGVPIFRWDEIWPGTPVLDGDHGLDWARRVFQLGCHQDLSLQDIGAIATTVHECLRS
jgi:dTDP-4-amino-4,6-dideoxygalactose transaminase